MMHVQTESSDSVWISNAISETGTDLELLCAIPETPGRSVDLLLVHGISAGAWMWEGWALDHLARAGYRSWALSLAGHGLSAGREDLDSFTICTYADDLEAALRAITRPTVIIAHSLGGAVAQKLLSRSNRLAGCVLLCSVPPYGLWRASLEMLLRTPDLWREMGVYSLCGLAAADMEVVRRGLFPSGIDDSSFDRLAARLQDESIRAVSGALGWSPFAPPPLSQSNMLVIGGAEDRLVPPMDVALTGLYYGVQAHIIAEAGHMLMFEESGVRAADIVLKWLDQLTAA